MDFIITQSDYFHPSVQLPESLSPFGGLNVMPDLSTVHWQPLSRVNEKIFIQLKAYRPNKIKQFKICTVLKPERFRVCCAFGGNSD